MANRTSTQNGDWGTGATWVGGVKPVAGDVVTIAHLVTVSGSEAAASVTISPTKRLTMLNGGFLVVAGEIFFDQSDLYVDTGESTIRCSTLVMDGAVFTHGVTGLSQEQGADLLHFYGEFFPTGAFVDGATITFEDSSQVISG